MFDPVYDPNDPERVAFIQENALSLLQDRDQIIERQRIALSQLQNQNEGLRAFQSWLSLVKDFHTAFGLPVRGRTLTFNPTEMKLRSNLIIEEVNELLEALGYGRNLLEEVNIPFYQEDPVQVADALADLLYVVIGACLVFGIPIDPVFREVHESNMSKLGPDGKPIYRDDGKVLKPDTWSPPNIEKLLNFRGFDDERS